MQLLLDLTKKKHLNKTIMIKYYDYFLKIISRLKQTLVIILPKYLFKICPKF